MELTEIQRKSETGWPLQSLDEYNDMDCKDEIILPGEEDDDDDECSNSEILNSDIKPDSEVTHKLASSGTVGLAAAAAITSSRKRNAMYDFETNPCVRKRQQSRLLRKLKMTMDELSSRVGLQAVVVVATPGYAKGNFKVFGSKPLEDVVRNLKDEVLESLELALEVQAPEKSKEDPTLYELPPLVVDGIPTPLEEMTQAQLRTFIPLMMKYSTGRGKPGWNRESAKPVWWPPDIPWANVRIDARSTDVKLNNSWTETLRRIVISCYKFHGREDLLSVYNSDKSKSDQINHSTQTFTTENGTVHQISGEQIIAIPEENLNLLQASGGSVQGGFGGQQLYFTSDDGCTYPVAVSSIITVPVAAPTVYQAFIPTGAHVEL